MVSMWETTESFPFLTLRGLGGTFLGFGFSLMGLGIFDIIWTVVKYTGRYDRDCPMRSNWTHDRLPCKGSGDNVEISEDLVWTWVAEGIWGGFLVLLVGILGLLFSTWRVRNLRLQRDMFGVGCILLIFPICPGIIALSILEIYYGNDMFFKFDGGEMDYEDFAKFIVPLLVGILALLAWIVAIVGAGVACCCAKIAIQETVYNKPAVAASQAGPLVMAQPQKPPMMMIQPEQPATTQYEVVAIVQPSPPPYYVTAPLGAPPPFMGRPPMMGPPMMGPRPMLPMLPPPPSMRGPHMLPPPPHMMPPPPMGYQSFGRPIRF